MPEKTLRFGKKFLVISSLKDKNYETDYRVSQSLNLAMSRNIDF